MTPRAKSAAALVALLVVVAAVLWWSWPRGDGGETAAPSRTTVASPSRTSSASPSGSAATARTSGAARTTTAASATDPETGLRWIDAADLPSQARTVLAQIDKGGPYAYAKDGSTFLNAERILPNKPRGFYAEYTVVTPGESDRGARRIVVGGEKQWFFWTDDHYASFSRIRR